VLAAYRYTESFPEREKYGLTHQLRRAAISIPANIAEGFGKRSAAEKARPEYRGRFCRRVPVLFDSVPRLRLWPERGADEHLWEETGKLLNAYIRAILASAF
jgi:hypothetical protein